MRNRSGGGCFVPLPKIDTSAQRFFVIRRAATTKDRASRSIPLPQAFAEELKGFQPEDGQTDQKVFFGIFPHYETFRADLKKAGIPHRDSAGHVVHFHSFRKTHATFAVRDGVAQKATQEVLGHSAANLTANIYAEIASSTICTELKKIPWITRNGVERPAEESARNCSRIGGADGQTVSDADKTRGGSETSKYLNSPLKRRILASLDTLRLNLEMVDAIGLTLRHGWRTGLVAVWLRPARFDPIDV